MKIGELASQSGVPASTIRFYEKRGLLPEARRLSSGYRSYDAENLRQLRMIKFAQDLGFSLDEMSVMMSGNAIDHDRTLEHLLDKQRELEQVITQLTEKKHNMANLIHRLQDSWGNNECMNPDTLNELMRSKSTNIQ